MTIEAHGYLENEEPFAKKDLLMFGESLGSPTICIGLGQENYGLVYVFDDDFGLTKHPHLMNL